MPCCFRLKPRSRGRNPKNRRRNRRESVRLRKCGTRKSRTNESAARRSISRSAKGFNSPRRSRCWWRCRRCRGGGHRVRQRHRGDRCDGHSSTIGSKRCVVIGDGAGRYRAGEVRQRPALPGLSLRWRLRSQLDSCFGLILGSEKSRRAFTRRSRTSFLRSLQGPREFSRLTTGAPAALIGVMVAVALIPPLVTFGLLVGSGRLALACNALLLFITNVICINLAGVVTLLLQKRSAQNLAGG